MYIEAVANKYGLLFKKRNSTKTHSKTIFSFLMKQLLNYICSYEMPEIFANIKNIVKVSLSIINVFGLL